MNKWQNSDVFKAAFKFESVKGKIGDQVVEFYPVSVGTAFKLRNMAKPVAKALAVLMDSRGKDDTSYRSTHTADGFNETISEAIAPELASLRHSQKQAAIEDIFAGLASDESLTAIGDIIVDSVRRSLFPNLEEGDLPKGKEFLDSAGLDRMHDLVIGVVKANRGVLGPLAGAVESALSKAGNVVAKRLTQSLPNSEPDGQASPETSDPSPATSPEPTKDGTPS